MKVKFYGKLASTFGNQMEMAITTPCTIAGLRSQILADHPEAENTLGDVLVRACVRDALVADDHQLGPSDEVEFLAPVSGG